MIALELSQGLGWFSRPKHKFGNALRLLTAGSVPRFGAGSMVRFRPRPPS